MSLIQEDQQHLQEFFDTSNFAENGWIITDMDGTVITEEGGSYSIHTHVVIGLRKMYELGRPIFINTLRFPLSVMRTYNKVWFSNFDYTVPAVLMNGSQLVEFTKQGEDDFTCKEIMAFPLTANEISEQVKRVTDMVNNDTPELLVFYYPRNWEKGEIIWTPAPDRIPAIQEKYRSASLVYNSPVNELQNNLLAEHICMMFILVEIPNDTRMAYQQGKRKKDFVTHKGVNKLFGTQQLAAHFGLSMEASLGAGDTDMDTFLNGVALPVHVGNPNLPFKSFGPAIKVENQAAFGDLLFYLASLQKEAVEETDHKQQVADQSLQNTDN